MSSEAAQKAFPDPAGLESTDSRARRKANRAAFDRGAVEALRQATMNAEVYGDFSAEKWLRQMRLEWEVGR